MSQAYSLLLRKEKKQFIMLLIHKWGKESVSSSSLVFSGNRFIPKLSLPYLLSLQYGHILLVLSCKVFSHLHVVNLQSSFLWEKEAIKQFWVCKAWNENARNFLSSRFVCMIRNFPKLSYPCVFEGIVFVQACIFMCCYISCNISFAPP